MKNKKQIQAQVRGDHICKYYSTKGRDTIAINRNIHTMRSAGIGQVRQERVFLSWGAVNKVERTEDLGR